MRIVLRLFYTLWAYLTFIVLLVFVFFLHIAIVAFTRKNRVERMYRIYRPWAYTWSFLNGVKIEVQGQEHICKDQSYIFVSNHGSAADAVIIGAAMTNRYRPLGKVEVTEIPIMGYILKRALVTVDRSSAESRRQSMEKMRDLIRKNISVLILPEGTRNRTGKPLQPFKEGAFRLAIEFQLPVVPMIILNTRKLFPNDFPLMNFSGLKCHFLKPVATVGMTEADIPMLKEQVFIVMEKHIIENEDAFVELREAQSH